MELPAEVRERFRRHGRKGGRTRAARMTPAARRSVARVAAVRRWTKERFGAPTFSELRLPGADLVDAGLADLAAGKETVAALSVGQASFRLRREGVPVPSGAVPDADHRLYRRLAGTEGEGAHARYKALREQIVSFAEACPLFRRGSDAA